MLQMQKSQINQVNQVNQGNTGNQDNSMNNQTNIQNTQQRMNMNMNMLKTPFPFQQTPMFYPMTYPIGMQMQSPPISVSPQFIPHSQTQSSENQNNKNSSINSTANEIKDKLQEAIKMIQKNPSENTSSKEDDLSSLKDENELNFEKEYSLEEENLENIWSGFLTKNKKDRIVVDFYQIRGNISDDNFNSEYNLNISHSTQYEEIMKRPLLGIIAISPQNVTQCEIFKNYIDYFNEKQRAGVINIKAKYTLYLVPPCEFSRKFYQNPKKHLLGIIVDSAVEPKPYVDMNKLSLPPPVISSTEKKLLSQKQKKNGNNSSNKN